ncbi:inosine-uridine preferring nucleoside hydrolase [Phlyctema vagabunda]|uniref:Inosine-uridine preferring nucleoside hydrolase n=1 Tax=Phlyctema vagabunda TaxID=108571 RepID=A0ABR4PY06_9HELO
MALNRVIIDTDPGVDDTLALLLALAAKPEELEILLISITYGNVEVQSCLKNAVALFGTLKKELEWRKARGQLEGFDAMKSSNPILAFGAEHPLEEDKLMADYFHGVDGLAGVHDKLPHLSPSDAWKTLFHRGDVSANSEPIPSDLGFQPSKTVAHKEILRLLKENPKDSITIIAVGPLTNLALAAAEDPETFLKVKEVCVMGGAIDVEGNVTPVAEFNTFADAVATARVFALTSLNPRFTMPPVHHDPAIANALPKYPTKLSRTLNLTLFPLDVTTPHGLHKSDFQAKTQPLIEAGSPLATWVSHFVGETFKKIESHSASKLIDPAVELHDPLCVWYALTRSAPSWMLAPRAPEDIRVETAAQWTRGMHVVDRRNRRKKGAPDVQVRSPGAVDITNPMDDLIIGKNEVEVEDEIDPSDNGGWLRADRGNRINRIVGTPGEDSFGPYLLERIFG